MGDARLLIGGKLVDAEGGGTFDNINPATEEVLGPVADGTAADMRAAIAAARAAFDTTSWATDHAFRKRCLLQLQAAIESEQEELRAELVAEVGCPVLLTYGPQLDAPLREALLWPAEMIDQFEWTRSLGPKDAFGMGVRPNERCGRSRSGSWPSSCRGTSRSRSSSTSSARCWPWATPACSSPPPTPRGTHCASVASSPRRPTSLRGW